MITESLRSEQQLATEQPLPHAWNGSLNHATKRDSGIQQGREIHMLLEGIGKPVQQLIAVVGMVGPVYREIRQTFSGAQVIQPLSAPGAIIQ